MISEDVKEGAAGTAAILVTAPARAQRCLGNIEELFVNRSTWTHVQALMSPTASAAVLIQLGTTTADTIGPETSLIVALDDYFKLC